MSIPTPVYTFDPTIPNNRDYVRQRIGDINGKPQWFVADQTIDWYLSQFSVDEAMAQICESIAAQCFQLATELTQGPRFRIAYTKRGENFLMLADRIRNLAGPLPTDPAQYSALVGKIQTCPVGQLPSGYAPIFAPTGCTNWWS